MFQVIRGVSQGSSLLSILFLFYNSKLLETYISKRDCLSLTGFVNDINILIYDISTKENCQCLKIVIVQCKTWAQRFEVAFASDKFELIHFTHSHMKFNLTVTVQLDDITVGLVTTVQILGL